MIVIYILVGIVFLIDFYISVIKETGTNSIIRAIHLARILFIGSILMALFMVLHDFHSKNKKEIQYEPVTETYYRKIK